MDKLLKGKAGRSSRGMAFSWDDLAWTKWSRMGASCAAMWNAVRNWGIVELRRSSVSFHECFSSLIEWSIFGVGVDMESKNVTSNQ